jgi:integrase
MNLPHTRVLGPSLYYYRKVNGKQVQVRLGRLDEGEVVLRARYLELKSPEPRSLADLLLAWQRDPEHKLQPRTRAEYNRQIEAKLIPVFGSIQIRDLAPGHVAKYLEARSNVSGNREVACLSTVLEWGIRKGYAESNPCRQVRRNKEAPRTRYISNLELGQALRGATPEFRDLLLAAYFTGFRQADLLSLRWSQVNKRELRLEEGKTRRRVVMSLSGPLSEVLRRARRRTDGEVVFTNTDGNPWRIWAVQSAMRRLGVEWTFHDLRAKAESDHKSGLGLLSRYKRARRLQPTR